MPGFRAGIANPTASRSQASHRSGASVPFGHMRPSANVKPQTKHNGCCNSLVERRMRPTGAESPDRCQARALKPRSTHVRSIVPIDPEAWLAPNAAESSFRRRYRKVPRGVAWSTIVGRFLLERFGLQYCKSTTIIRCERPLQTFQRQGASRRSGVSETRGDRNRRPSASTSTLMVEASAGGALPLIVELSAVAVLACWCGIIGGWRVAVCRGMCGLATAVDGAF